MTKDEFVTWFAKEVQSLWPAWQVTSTRLKAWCEGLKRFGDDVLTRAVEWHYTRDSPSEPRLRQVRSLARRIASDSMSRRPKTDPHARDNDPQAYDLLMQQRAAQGALDPALSP